MCLELGWAILQPCHLMFKVDNKHIMWTGHTAFGTNVKLGHICVPTLLLGDWAAMLLTLSNCNIVCVFPECLWAQLPVECTSAALPPGLSLPNKPRDTAAVTDKVCGVYRRTRAHNPLYDYLSFQTTCEKKHNPLTTHDHWTYRFGSWMDEWEGDWWYQSQKGL